MIRQCIVCGKDFICSPSDKTITCSKSCSIVRKQQSHKGVHNSWNQNSRERKSVEGMTDNLRKGTSAAKRSPRSGSFVTNVNAKDWILVDPTGKEHHVRNLRLWCKNNAAEIFGREPDQVRSGFTQVKLSMQGKRPKSPVMYYMEWGLRDTWS